MLKLAFYLKQNDKISLPKVQHVKLPCTLKNTILSKNWFSGVNVIIKCADNTGSNTSKLHLFSFTDQGLYSSL